MLKIFPGKENSYQVIQVAAECTVKELLHKLINPDINLLQFSKVEKKLCATCNYADFFNYSCLMTNDDNLYIEIHNTLQSNIFFCPKCSTKTLNSSTIFNTNILFIEWLTTDGLDRESRLCDLRVGFKIKYDKINYNFTLTGAIQILGGNPLSPKSIGHYVAFCRRINSKWETYNDLKDAAEAKCSPEQVITCAMLVYVRNS